MGLPVLAQAPLARTAGTALPKTRAPVPLMRPGPGICAAHPLDGHLVGLMTISAAALTDTANGINKRLNKKI